MRAFYPHFRLHGSRKWTYTSTFLLVLLLLLLAGRGSAWATTKTVTYIFDYGMLANHSSLKFVSMSLDENGDTPFEGATTIEPRMFDYNTSAYFSLPDGFTFSFDWGSATALQSSGIGFCHNDVNLEYRINWNFINSNVGNAHYYVTSIRLTDIYGNPMNLEGGGTATADFTFSEVASMTFTAARGSASSNSTGFFKKLVITYSDVITLTSENTDIGIADEYFDDGINEPVPTVVYKGAHGNVTLVKYTDYSIGYWKISSTQKQISISGKGKYTGTITKEYTLRGIQLSDFHQLGDGSYEIASKDDLYRLSRFVNNQRNNCHDVIFRQTADIVCDNNFIPIGNTANSPFCGTYDGQGFTISGITVSCTGQTDDDKYVGLFGYIRPYFEIHNTHVPIIVLYYGLIKNVVLASSTFTGHQYVGGIAGYVCGAVINCRVEDSVTVNAGAVGAQYIGGIAGYLDNGSKHDDSTSWSQLEGIFCAATVSSNGMTGCSYLGGLVGYVDNYITRLHDCLFLGNMSVSDASNFGGIAGGGSNCSLLNNYFIASGVSGAIDGSDIDGARRGHIVTLEENVSLAGAGTSYNVSGLTVIGSRNYALRQGSTIYSGESQNLGDLSYSGSIPDGQSVLFTVNGEGVSGNYFTMPARDVTIGVTFISSDLLFLTGMHNNGFYWSTFYDGTKRYSLPEGATAYTMDKDYHLYRLGTDGRTIPEDIAVVIIADKEEITLTRDNGTSEIDVHGGENILQGSDSEVPVNDFYGDIPYVLGVAGDVFGFHPYGGASIPANKAYYLTTQ